MTLPGVLAAAGWGLVGGLALIVGAVASLYLPIRQRWIGLITAFGVGVLISALTFELTGEAFRQGGADATATGLTAGALAFFAGDWIIDRRGGNHRKRSGEEQRAGADPPSDWSPSWGSLSPSSSPPWSSGRPTS